MLRKSRIKNELETKTIPVTESGCLLWLGSIDKYGYGTMKDPTLTRRTANSRTHRMAWEVIHGEIPKGLCVLHKCDTRSCVNVNHLFLGSVYDNQIDASKKGKLAKKISNKDVYNIVELYKYGFYMKEIAKMYDVHIKTIARAINTRYPLLTDGDK